MRLLAPFTLDRWPRHLAVIVLAALALAGPALAAETPAAADRAAPASGVPERPSIGALDFGALHQSLSDGYPSWDGAFLRGSAQVHERNIVGFETAWLREFGDRGFLFAANDLLTLHQRWLVSAGFASSAGGFFLPRWRADAGIHCKWLEGLNLVTSLSASAINSKDGHRDRAAEGSAAYYFSVPWVVQAGLRVSRSQPGAVLSPSGFAAVTFGQARERYVSLRVAVGREAYQIIDAAAPLVDFPSASGLLTWRQWIGARWGFQVRAELYKNPYYTRGGGELGMFLEL